MIMISSCNAYEPQTGCFMIKHSVVALLGAAGAVVACAPVQAQYCGPYGCYPPLLDYCYPYVVLYLFL
jgi:hypothetical protein